ncbi:hypothetical protein GCM10007913_35200 [Devosia yakushimensis]|uniref:Sialidase domain-containing protein n=1 Tax=Devosia yakushimensis TaxID=470028 RepID=A0ABQ5UHP5_9HYPH|nr:sialidase family protein [Devosia yakushimensis]GLQ11588.1 hypothetical protein GCM10007913_35200 [Devosia yakushimensis]
MIQHVEVYARDGEFAAWPANYGLWIWGDEVVAVFSQGYRGGQENLHARDKTRPFIGKQARSLDGGLTWVSEPFNGAIPGGTSLSGDEHVIEALQSQPNIVRDRDLPPLAEPIDFTDPETILMCARTGLDAGSISWFYVSRDRARSWQGPYRIGDFGLPGISARTDIVPLGKHDALFLLTAVKANGKEGRVFAARTSDGGRSFSFEGFVGEEPEGYGIMPASLRQTDGSVLTLVRCATPGKGPDRRAWIDQYRSRDEGRTWTYEGRPVPNTGYGGNPPTLNRLKDGRLVMVYGFRDAPFGMRARFSSDNGVSWGDEIVLRDDGGMSDLGYPRSVVRDDGKVLTVYYYNYGMDRDRFIGGTLFDPAEI